MLKDTTEIQFSRRMNVKMSVESQKPYIQNEIPGTNILTYTISDPNDLDGNKTAVVYIADAIPESEEYFVQVGPLNDDNPYSLSKEISVEGKLALIEFAALGIILSVNEKQIEVANRYGSFKNERRIAVSSEEGSVVLNQKVLYVKHLEENEDNILQDVFKRHLRNNQKETCCIIQTCCAIQ